MCHEECSSVYKGITLQCGHITCVDCFYTAWCHECKKAINIETELGYGCTQDINRIDFNPATADPVPVPFEPYTCTAVVVQRPPKPKYNATRSGKLLRRNADKEACKPSPYSGTFRDSKPTHIRKLVDRINEALGEDFDSIIREFKFTRLGYTSFALYVGQYIDKQEREKKEIDTNLLPLYLEYQRNPKKYDDEDF